MSSRVAHFFNVNQSQLLSYTIAWAVILASIGTQHGYQHTTIPFAIGMGVGCGIGLVGGAIRACVFEAKNSIGAHVTKRAVEDLDFTTRNIALTVFTTIYLMQVTRMPYGIGGLTGALIGEYVSITAYWGRQMKEE